jgi:monofunctional glycosyltransferase
LGCLKRAEKTGNYQRHIALVWNLNQKRQNLRIARNVLLAVLAVLLLPYVLVPFYRAGHPVSALMAWRWATGVDWDALREVIDDAEDGEASRGGSTITQQVVKNLFLWPGRSVVRKALELPLALWTDWVLPKQRILEIYLNIAELGPSGQFGAQTGALYAFGHPASALSPREAALLAAILPNPVRRSARNPGPGVRRLAGIYTVRAQASELQHCWSENRGF